MSMLAPDTDALPADAVRPGWRDPRPPASHAAIFLLAIALVASGTLLLAFNSNLTFVGDGWELLLVRQGWTASTFMEPFNQHLILGPALVYKLLLAAFGMDSALPYYAVSISLFLLSAVLLFAYLRSRVGDWSALVAAVLVLFLGAASEDLLWEFQMGFFGSIAAGLGMLVALDRGNRGGDRAACGLLTLSLAFSGVGLAFGAAGLADLGFGRRPRGRRAYVTLLPLAAYGLWAVAWGHTSGSQLSLHDVVELPRHVFDAAAAGIASLLGQEPLGLDGPSAVICQALVVVLFLVVAIRIRRQQHVSRGLAIALALAFGFWMLTGVADAPGRYAVSSRYQYPSAVFLLIIAAEVLRGLRIPRLCVWALAAVAASAVFGGVSLLHRDYTNTWMSMSENVRLTLAAVDIAGEATRQRFEVMLPPSVVVPAKTYLRARERYGSPAFGETELLSLTGSKRQFVDRTLATALGIALTPIGQDKRSSSCRRLPPAREGTPAVRLRSGTITLTSGRAGAELWLGRFSHGFPVELGRLPPGATQSLSIPVDTSRMRWRLVALDHSIRMCAPPSTGT
jgi:hypothetical protein